MKVKILLLSLLLMISLTAKVDAQEFSNINSNNIFNNINSFFEEIFSNESSTYNGEKQEQQKSEGKDSTDAVADYVENSGYACNTDECNNSTDYASLSNINGITIEKTMEGTGETQTGLTAEEPVVPGESVNVTLKVTNTGNVDGQPFTITDSLDDPNIEVDGAAAVAVTPDNPAAVVTPAAPTVADLQGSGIVIAPLDSGESVTLTFSVKVIDELLDLEFGNSNDVITNMATACVPFDGSVVLGGADPYDYVKTNKLGLKDGTIFGTSPNQTLCSTDSSELFMDTNGDGIVDPGNKDLISSKTVKDTNSNNLAEAAEELTYTIAVQNVTDSPVTAQIKDALDTDSLDNVTFDPATPLLNFGVTGSQLTDDSGNNLTIAQLNAGFDYTLDPQETLVFTFKGTVIDNLDYFSLNNGYIVNEASICSKVGIDNKCDYDTASINAGDSSGMKVEKTVDITNLDTDADGSLANNAPGQESDSSKLTYTINVENTSDKDLNNVVITDSVPEEDITYDPAEILVYTPADTYITEPVEGTATIDDLKTGITLQTLPAGETFGIQFSVAVNESYFTTTPIPAGHKIITNSAQACIDTDCRSDAAITVSGGDVVANPDLGIVKSAEISDTEGNSDEVLDSGETITYNLAITNGASEPVIINLKDELTDQAFTGMDESTQLSVAPPEFGKFVDATGADLATPPTLGDLKTGNVYLEVVGEQTVNVTFTITPNVDNPTTVDNPALVENNVTACGDSNADGNVDTATECSESATEIPIEGNSFLSMTKSISAESGTVPDLAEPGETLTYKISVKNEGNQTVDFTLKDNLIDSNIDLDETLLDQTLTITPTQGTYTLNDLISDAGIQLTIEAGQEITVEFNAKVTTGATVAYPGSILENTAQASYKDVDGNDVAINGNVQIATDPAVPVVPNGSISKKIIDEDGDGIAESGEKISFKISAYNTSDTDMTYNIKEKDPMDPNFNFTPYLAEAIEPLAEPDTSNGAKFVDEAGVDKSYLTSDLITETTPDQNFTANPGGIYAFIPAGGEISFVINADMKEPYAVPSTEVTNSINLCYESTVDSGTYDSCNFTTAAMDTPGYEDLDIKKEVVSAADSEGNDLQTEAGDPYAVDDGSLTYKVTITNTGSTILSGLVFKDDINDSFFDVAGTELVTANEYDSAGTLVQGPATIPVNITGTAPNEDTSITATYPSDLPAGNYIEISFTFNLNNDLQSVLESGNMIPNIAETCYTSNGLSVEGPGTGAFCYSDGVNTPYTTDVATPPTAVSNDEFAIEKRMDAGTDNQVDPGEEVTFHIGVTNNDVNEDGQAKDILVTDELADKNLMYENALQSPLTITDLTQVNGATTTQVVAQLPDGSTFDGTNATVEMLLPDIGTEADWKDSSAFARYTDGEQDPAGATGGISVTIPANHTIEFTFKVNAQGNLTRATKFENAFNWKKYLINNK